MKYLINCRRISGSALSTIYALSSGYGKCGVAVIRVSGQSSREAIFAIAGFDKLPSPRMASLRMLKHPIDKQPIDRGLVLWFPGPKSFTGEDSCEFQVHGGLAVVAAMFDALDNIPDMRPALPGEFSRRAFSNGKLDLTAAEGLADLIHAETEAQRKQALLQADGTLSQLYREWSGTLLNAIAHLEAYIDFSEDQHIEDSILAETNNNIQKVENEIRHHLNDNRRGERLRQGVRAVIVGEPNVGKSSFLNMLCQRPAAIVTPIAGTTRDIVEINLNIGGYPVIVADTAGLRTDTLDIVEKEGINKAHDYVQFADLIIILIDATKYIIWQKESTQNCMMKYIQDYTLELGLNNVIDESMNKIKSNIIVVTNKIDLINSQQLQDISSNGMVVLQTSCVHDKGFNTVTEKLTEHLQILCGTPCRECPTLSQVRHRHLLTKCVNYLERHRKLLDEDANPDLGLLAQNLHIALRQIGKITGSVSTEDILDVIFRDFCIGK